MSERLSKKSEGGRENLIKANAALDAGEYIKLMRKLSPDNLSLNAEGSIILNLVEGEKFFEEKRKELNLNEEEFAIYLLALADRAEEILKEE